MKANRGFTLVELMIVVALVGVVAGITLPLGDDWVRRAELTGTRSEVSYGVGKAIGTALRNRHAVARGVPVAAVCLSEAAVLTVLEGDVVDAPSCAGGSGTVIWTADLDPDVQITTDGNAISCLCFDNVGLLTTNLCPGCLDRTTFDLTVGERHEQAFVY